MTGQAARHTIFPVNIFRANIKPGDFGLLMTLADLSSIDVTPVDLLPGDICLLCCDGLTGMVTDARIAEILAGEKDLNAACTELIDEANANGGVDNITVALVRYAP